MPHADPWTPAAAISAIDEKLTTADVHEPAVLSLDKSGPLPYWLVNVPRNQWPVECPDFLRDLPEKNVQILSTPDEHYRRQDWKLVKEIISAFLQFTNRKKVMLRQDRNEPDRSLSTPPDGSEKVFGVYLADQGAVWVCDAVCGQGAIALGRWGGSECIEAEGSTI